MVDKHSQKTMMTKVKLAVMLGLSTGLLAAISGTTLPVFAGGNGDRLLFWLESIADREIIIVF